ncbi:sedoheptulokinase [Hydra vulgaris]|nr:sedoheptulokinase [Hydra vulgaris]
MSFSVGIDIGTTSIKVCILKNCDVIESFSASHNATVSTSSRLFHEQSPELILQMLDHCLNQLKHIKEVDKICITGQMHGLLLWEQKQSQNTSNNSLISLYKNTVFANTNLITWQDQRCDEVFLKSLSCPNISSGFGLASMLWLQRETPNIFNSYHMCGTIMDFVVWLLTLKKKPYMSVHNANSWGYFDLLKNCWMINELQLDLFDCSILPDVVPAGTILGNICYPVYGMSCSSVVYVALGDHQCSIRACSAQLSEAVLNMGTSCQLSIRVPYNQDSMTSVLDIKSNSPTIAITPYDKNFVLLTAASLNGGNVFDQFVSTFLSWCQIIGCSNIPSNEELMDKLLSISPFEDIRFIEDSLIITPTIYGERHDPSARASISNISPSNLTLSGITQALFEGLSKNLLAMLPLNCLKKYGITQIAGTGRCFVQCSRLREAISKDFEVPWRLVDKSRDASLGAILFSLDMD